MIDLRSDTGTLPTDAMREAMRNAEVGDDGRGEDPTVAELEALSAGMMGKEAALFCNSGTMANIIAVLSQVARGEVVAINQQSHMYATETSIFSDEYFGRKARFFQADSYGKPNLSSLHSLFVNEKISLLSLENTLGDYGGTCLTVEETEAICAEAKKYQVPVHIDGARIFNAATYLNRSVAELARPADTVMFCLSKGLGAPIGSVLCGSRELIAKARVIRKAIGGNMRQSGIVAAAGLVAVHEAARITEDHKHTEMLLKMIHPHAFIQIDRQSVQTNMLKIDISQSKLSAEVFMKGLKKRGLYVKTMGKHHLRLVLHRDITQEQVRQVAQILNSFCEEMS